MGSATEGSATVGRGRLDQRRIVITGAASGIARSTAELFHREGASLALIDREEESLAAVAEQLGATPYVLDLTDLDRIDTAIDDLETALGGIDGVVNCAGLGRPLAIGDTDKDTLMQFAAVNLLAPYLICRAALPALGRASQPGTIVNVSSGMGLLPNLPNNTAYGATKGGLISFSKALAAEVGPRIRVNAVCPGVTLTPMTAPILAGYDDPSDAPFTAQYALKRVADPLEIAQAILFLTSDESSFVTGTAMAVDGGRTFH
jgi:NAD(P)-dependent dehydrogenase (short-subunit alcohol dehydrogenase family)